MPEFRKIIVGTTAWSALSRSLPVSLLMLTGCYSPVVNPPTTNPTAVALNLPKPTPRGVTVSGRLVYSADESRPPVDLFLDSARRVISEPMGLDRLVQRWPDVSAEILRQSAANQADLPARLAIAESYDRLFAVADAQAGWRAALASSRARPDQYIRFRTLREQMLALIQAGEFSRASGIDSEAVLPSDAPSAWRVEAMRLAGLSALLDDKPSRAVEFFSARPNWPALAPGTRNLSCTSF